MSEVQRHGFDFEGWVKDVLGMNDISTKYTDKWDIPGKISISIKLMGKTNALELSSAVRFWETDSPFIMVVGRWVQKGEFKEIVSIDELQFTTKILDTLKGRITLHEIKEFDRKIRSYPPGKQGQIDGSTYSDAWKKERESRMGLLNVAAKLDSKTQRRIQCNLNYHNYVQLFGEPCGMPILRGHKFTTELPSGTRKFHKSENRVLSSF